MTDGASAEPGCVPIRFADLFAGIGGFRIAFETQGCECVFSSEWDKYCRRTYAANFGDVPHGDIRTVGADEIPDHDVLVAGFPCQPFSIAGVSKKASLGRRHGFADETQGSLFFEITRVLAGKQPGAFLLENVKHLQSHDKGRTFRVIAETLHELGYEVFAKVIDARDYVPQHRERVFLVGFRQDSFANIDFQFPARPNNRPQVKDILQSRVERKYTVSDHLWQYLRDYSEKHRKKGNGFGYGLIDPAKENVTRTLSARYYKDGSEILIKQRGRNPRRLTPRECARLMGFSDAFKIVVSDTQAYRQFGNAIVVPVVEAIAKQMIRTMNNHEALQR